MSVFSQFKEKKKKRLFRANSFKNRFLTLWQKEGTFINVDGVEYLDEYRISGSAIGAKKMAKLLMQPTLNIDVLSNKCIEKVDLLLNTSRLVELTPAKIESFLIDYRLKNELQSYDRLKYSITKESVVYSFFVKDDEIINNSFLNQLAKDIATSKRIKLKGDFGLDDRTLEPLEAFSFNSEVTTEEINAEIQNFGEGELFDIYAEELDSFLMLDLRSRILSFTFNNDYGTNILPILDKVSLLYYYEVYRIPYQELKKMNAEVFLKLIKDILDFNATTKDSCFWRKALFSLLIFVVAIVYIVLTGDIYGGFSILATTFGETLENENLKIIGGFLGIVSAGVNELGSISFEQLNYIDGINIISNIYSMHNSMSIENNIKKEVTLSTETTSAILYFFPYGEIYSSLYEYETLICVEP